MAGTPKPRIAFTTLGCKVNQSETDLYARQFTAAGYECVPFEAKADVYVVNTCTVTHVADRKSRQLLNHAHRTNPGALVVAAGCYASIVGDMLATDRTLVIRNRDKGRMVQLVQGRLQHRFLPPPSNVDIEKYLEVETGYDRARAAVKAQDGCDSHCTYCIIPRARGRSRSVAPLEILRRVQVLVHEGHAEVVLTGVDLGSYGEDDNSLPDLGGLLTMILEQIEGVRIRVSSLEPGDFNEAWLDLWKSPRLCRHLHVPLQSGSAGVLARMERTYAPGAFAAMVDACRSAIPDVTITTDVMAGFPGETDAEFQESLDFVRAVRFDGMHVFKYSQRGGTRAAHFPGQVSDSVKAERAQLLRGESSASTERLLRRHARKNALVAWEGCHDNTWRGLTDTNVRVYGSSECARRGTLTEVRLGTAYRDGLWSEPVQAEIPLMPVR